MRVKRGFWQRPAEELAIDYTDIWHGTSEYISITRDGKMTQLHRWLWQQLKGPIPEEYLIDHINQNKRDCRIDNLRCVPNAYNNRNKPKTGKTKPGMTGVYRFVNKHGTTYWAAAFFDTSKNRHNIRYFSTKKYGEEGAKQAAMSLRKEKLAELVVTHGYTETHGQ